MGLSSDLFGNSDSPEARLVNERIMELRATGYGQEEATSKVREMVTRAAEIVVERGLSNQPANYGDLLLQQEASNPKIHLALETIRAEGVRDEDIRWWWNKSALERVMIEQDDEINRTSAFYELLRDGFDGEQAAKKLFAIHPKFGTPAEGDGDDGPIPIELKRRIVEFTERYSDTPELLRQKAEQATSFNALIRAEIRAGTFPSSVPRTTRTPSPTGTPLPWWLVLRVAEDASFNDITAAYRRLVAENHPERERTEAEKELAVARMSTIDAALARALQQCKISASLDPAPISVDDGKVEPPTDRPATGDPSNQQRRTTLTGGASHRPVPPAPSRASSTSPDESAPEWMPTAGTVAVVIGVLGFLASGAVGGGKTLGGAIVAGVLNPLFFVGVPLGLYWLYRAGIIGNAKRRDEEPLLRRTARRHPPPELRPGGSAHRSNQQPPTTDGRGGRRQAGESPKPDLQSSAEKRAAPSSAGPPNQSAATGMHKVTITLGFALIVAVIGVGIFSAMDHGNGSVVEQNGRAITKGSFSVWTIPADPVPRQAYWIVIEVKLPSHIYRYQASDLSGTVVGTDLGMAIPWDRYWPGHAVRPGSQGSFIRVKRGDYLPVKNHRAQLMILIPAAAALVKDTIDIRSKILGEEQTLQIIY